jgi:uncharacterized membrane protein
MTVPLPLDRADALALAFFLASWILFALAVDGRLIKRVSLTQAMNVQREAWMHTMARRELRMIDTSIMAGLQQGTAFFASSSLIAIGGCFALLGATDQVLAVLADMPFFSQPGRGVLETKAIGLVMLFAYAFFKFGWAYRLFNYCSILIGAVPVLRDEAGHQQELEIAVRRAARMNVLAGKHFNAGLRGVFFSIGYLGWFAGPAVFAATTVLLLIVLLRRQFFSRARQALIDPPPSLGSRQQRVDAPGQPIAGEADPFADGHRRDLQ